MFIAATVIHLKTFITFFQHCGKDQWSFMFPSPVVHRNMPGTRQGFHQFLLYILCKLGAICPQAHESWVQWVFWSMTVHIPGAAASSNEVEYFWASAHRESSFGISLLTAFNQGIHRARWTLSLTKNYLDSSDIPSGATPVTVCTHKLTDGPSNLWKHLHMNMYHLDWKCYDLQL